MTQGQFHKALAVAQSDCILARHGAKGLGCAPNHNDDGIATPILRKQVVYGVPVHRTDALGVTGGTQSGPLIEAFPYPLPTDMYKKKEPWTWALHLTQPLRSCMALSKLFLLSLGLLICKTGTIIQGCLGNPFIWQHSLGF